MFRLSVVLACLVLLAAPTIAGAGASLPLDEEPSAATTVERGVTNGSTIGVTSDAPPTFSSLYPNPVAEGDAGEFVGLSVPAGTDLGAYVLSDGERNVSLPNRTASGRVVITDAPSRVRALLDVPGSTRGAGESVEVVGVERGLDLSNAGERVRLLRENRSVAVVRYGSAPEGERYDAATGRWEPLGLTDFAVFTAGPTDVRAFVLPDAATVPIETVRQADDRLFLAAYTLTSERVADALVAAHRRGVDVRVLVEGGPVGGISHRQGRTLDRLARAGVPVRVMHGPAVRYAYHHAKYAVADDRALVLTENWKPSGTGGRSSRGWGAGVRDRRVADRLAAVFRADAGWRDSLGWRAFRAGRRFQPAPAANASFDPSFEPRTVHASGTELLAAPDNAGGRVRGLVRNATDRVRVIQVSVDRSFARELVEAARRGVEVEVLLAGAWYVREDNQALADRLNRRAAEEDLPLTARLAQPSGYEKIHAKGLVVDDDAVALGSLNWNEHAATENREVVVVLHGEEPATYYGDVFAHDWRASAGGRGAGTGGSGGTPADLPADLFALVGIAVVLALVAARRIDFGDEDPFDPDRPASIGDVGGGEWRADEFGAPSLEGRVGDRSPPAHGARDRRELPDSGPPDDAVESPRRDGASNSFGQDGNPGGVAAKRNGSDRCRRSRTDEPDHRL